MIQRQEKQKAGNSNKYYWDYKDDNGNIVATCLETYHSTIPYEVYVFPSHGSKRISSFEEAEQFINSMALIHKLKRFLICGQK